MVLRNQVEWALHCLAVLASVPAGKRLATKDLAEFHGVPKEYLLKALQELSRAGFIEGNLGPTGGYRLARSADRITFLDVVEAIEGPRRTFVCTEIRKNMPCTTPKRAFSKPCQVAKVMHRADEAWRRALGETTIADLVEQVASEVPAKMLETNGQWLAGKIK
jgi:Rrf2 family protein